jgi:TonB family protein
MLRPSPGFPLFCFCVFGWIFFPAAIRAQTPPPAPPRASNPLAVKLEYPDNPGGLEKLAKDIMKAQRENDPSRAGELLQSLLLPNPRAWYTQVFGERTAAKEGAQYESIADRLPLELASAFVNASQDHMTEISSVRFDKSCDDNAGETTFGMLQVRLDPVPLYELRLIKGNQFRRLFPFAYADGGFRFILSPKMEEFVPSRPLKLPPGTSPGDENGNEPPEPRIRVGGNVTAAKITSRVSPQYPTVARNEHLQGTVRLHAVIGKDGNIKNLNVIKGYCSLAEASVEAVRKWRYQPTLINGQPVEVDTTVDVIFKLND